MIISAPAAVRAAPLFLLPLLLGLREEDRSNPPITPIIRKNVCAVILLPPYLNSTVYSPVISEEVRNSAITVLVFETA